MVSMNRDFVQDTINSFKMTKSRLRMHVLLTLRSVKENCIYGLRRRKRRSIFVELSLSF